MSVVTKVPTSPYKGLVPFEEADAAYFLDARLTLTSS